MIANSNFITENGCKNPPKDRFAAAERVTEQAEQLIYAIRDAKEYAGISKFDDMLKQVEELRNAAFEYAVMIVIGEIGDSLQEEAGGEQ